MVEINREHPTFEDLEVLAEASQLLTVVDLDHVLHEVIALISRTVGAQKTSLFLHEGEQVAWDHLITMRELSPDQTIKVVSQVLDDGFAGWVYAHKKGDIIYDTIKDERWIVFPDDPIITRSAMCVPFIYKGDVIASVTLIHSKPNHFQPYHLRLMEIIANQATVAIHNAQLFKSLNEQRQQLHAVLQSMREVLLVLDDEQRIVILNRAALPLLGLSRQEEALGVKLSDFDEVDEVIDSILARLNGHTTEETQRWGFETRSEKRQMDYQVRLTLWDDGHDLLGYVVVMHDITRLRDLSRFKTEMLNVASHDLRSPLALVSGYADMVAIDTPDENSPVHEYIGTIKGQVQKMSNLVDDLLRVERIRKSPLELREKTNLAALLKVVLVNSRPLAMAKTIIFQSDIQLEGIPTLVADPVLIRQAMDNLISNAIKYTPKMGKVSVKAYYDEQHFHFIVEDTGYGIPEEHQPYVFESFYRVKSRKHKEKGSGLGLSLVKNVITRHDGDVWLESEVDKGSRFGFWLPFHSNVEDSNTRIPDIS